MKTIQTTKMATLLQQKEELLKSEQTRKQKVKKLMLHVEHMEGWVMGEVEGLELKLKTALEQKNEAETALQKNMVVLYKLYITYNW